MWRAKERRESKHPQAPWLPGMDCGLLWAVDAAPTIACLIGDLACWPRWPSDSLGDGWNGGSRWFEGRQGCWPWVSTNVAYKVETAPT
jgi:hypothetical protein